MLFKEQNCPKCNSKYDEALHTCPFCGEENNNPQTQALSKKITMLSWPRQLIIFLIGSFGVSIIAVIATLIAVVIANPDIGANETIVAGINETFIGNAVSYASTFLVISLLIWTSWKFILPNLKRWQTYVFALVGALILILFGLLYGQMISEFAPITDNQNQQIAEKIILKFPVGAIIVLGIIGPIVEEFTYRLGLFSLLSRINKVLAYILTILIFALIHFDFLSIGKATFVNELLNLPTYIIAGAVLSYIYEKYGLFASIFAHISYNLFVIVTTLLSL